MQLSPSADAVGFATLTSHLVDIALDQGGPLEGNLQGMLQVLEKMPQGLAQAADGMKFFLLHLIILYNIQNYTRQEKNR